jgi:hypothetical protein
VQSDASDYAAGNGENVRITSASGGALCLSPGATRGTYTSPAVSAAFPFNAIAPSWRAHVPSEAALEIELRTRAVGDSWSRWLPVEPLYAGTGQSTFHAEVPLLVTGGHWFQYRLTMLAPSRQARGSAGECAASPVLSEIAVAYYDTSIGPTTAQAKRMSTAGSVEDQGAPQPRIIPRAGWGADEGYRYDQDGDLIWPLEHYPAVKVVIHHTVTTNDYDESEAAGWVRAIYYYHAVTLGWGDIGYNYLVDRYGNLYEGRYGGAGVVAGHVYGYNYGSVGIAAMGTHGNVAGSLPPEDVALAAIADLCAWEAGRSYIHPGESAPFWDATPPNVGGHRDYPPFSTSCPGDELYAEMPALRQSVWDRIVTHTARYQVDWVAWEDLSPVVQADRTYTVPLRVRNAGWLTWPQSGVDNPVRLGYHWLRSDGQPVAQPPEDDHRTPLTYPITFGHSHDLSARVTTPITPGVYTLAWDMVHEGITWFHDADPSSPLLTRTVTATAPIAIAGPLVDIFGRPVEAGRVSLPGWLAVDAASGSYTLPLPGPGTYTITASAAGYDPLPPAYNVDATHGDTSYPFALVPGGFVDRIANGGFESGLEGWTTRGISVTSFPSRAAHTGVGAAPLTGTCWLSQSLRLPAVPPSPTLSLLYDVPSPGDGAILQVALSRAVPAETWLEPAQAPRLTYTLPTTVTGWTHFHAGLPLGWDGPLTLQLQISQTNALSPTAVLVDEIRLGHMPFTTYLPFVRKSD